VKTVKVAQFSSVVMQNVYKADIQLSYVCCTQAADVEAEVEKRMILERAEHKRVIADLRAELMAKPEKVSVVSDMHHCCSN